MSWWIDVDRLEYVRDSKGLNWDIAIFYSTDTDTPLPGGASDPDGAELCVPCFNGDSSETQKDRCRDATIALLHAAYGFSGLTRSTILVDGDVNV